MITVTCPRHGTRVLLDLSQLESLQRKPSGFEVRYRCSCGHHGSTVVTRLATSK